jgi:hypothetical protein
MGGDLYRVGTPIIIFVVTGVDILVKPKLAELFQANMLLTEKEALKAFHQYTALKVAPGWQTQDGSEKGVCWLGSRLDERLLLGWHGTSDDVIDAISRDCFDPRYAGTVRGSMFGRGIYFAENSSKADLYAGPKDSFSYKYGGKMSVILAVMYCGSMYEAKGKETLGCMKPPEPTSQQANDAGIKRWTPASPNSLAPLQLLLVSCMLLTWSTEYH